MIIASAGFGLLIRVRPLYEAIIKLGFPVYVMTIIGPALVAAAIVILIPRLPLLKEWAYAGLAIDLVSATAAHAAAGDSLPSVLVPMIVLSVGVVSYLTRPVTRRLAASPSLEGWLKNREAHSSAGVAE